MLVKNSDLQSRTIGGVPRRRRIFVLTFSLILIAGGLATWLLVGGTRSPPAEQPSELTGQVNRQNGTFAPTPAQWATLTVEPVTSQVFRSEHVTEGKIAVDEDRATPIFSPYSGRVTKLLANPGDSIVRGQPLFVIEATDMVQAQNDFIAGIAARNKAHSQLSFAEADAKRFRTLSKDRAVALRDAEQAEIALVGAQNDTRAAETALEAVKNRLRILGKTDDEIRAFEETGSISPETPIYAPIGGTIVQRKIGPGQYVTTGAPDPIYVVGDLSTVWLVAYVRETEASKIRIGQPISFSLLAYPGGIFRGNIRYVATTLDAGTRRLLVRANIPNQDRSLKPEMYATVNISTDEGDVSPAVPREAVLYEGSMARVWVARDDKTIELRPITIGITDGRMIQVLTGLRPAEKVITKGSLFIDREATGS